MPKGFFAGSRIQSKQKASNVPKCGGCGLRPGCKTPNMPPSGEGHRKVLIVAEAPGKNEDRRGIQLIGDAGQKLRRVLKSVKVDLDRDCWKTNAVTCRTPENRTPTSIEVEGCRPQLLKAIRKYKPETIILLGGTAVEGLLGTLWGNDTGAIGRWVGWRIPSQELNAWVCPTWHPSYLIRQDGNHALELHFRRHLKAAFELKGRPWGEVPPNYTRMVNTTQDPEDAANIIRGLIPLEPSLLAFDYETNMLKPDGPDAEIVTASICWGWPDRDIEPTCWAFPWHGPVVNAMGELLKSKIPKVAANLKFEERWTRRILGHGVRNWEYDTMVGAHALDHRTGITGLKFQSFVRFGVPRYDEHISEYLGGKTSRSKNRIREIDMRDLLLYNGMDSLLEWKLATADMGRFDG